MPAAGGDVDTPALADGAGDFELGGEDVLKRLGGRAARGCAGIAVRGIERDQINLRVEPPQQFADGAGVGLGIVFPLDQRPLVKDAAASHLAIGATGGHEFVERPFFCGGHEGGALGLVGGMEGNGEVERAHFPGEAQNPRHDANRAERDPLGAEREAGLVAENVDGGHDRVVVMQGLAHAHEHDVAEALGLWNGL